MEPDWQTTKVMREIYSSLNKIESFINAASMEGLVDAYEDKYDAPLSMANIDFWRTVIGVEVHR
jgi:hypothetical protein